MSGGWIKWEKDLKDDPRVIRMASRLRNACVTQCDTESVTGLLGEGIFAAMVLGGLSKLWSYADTHVRNDDTIELGIDDINKVVGIHGFAQFLPEDWLEIIDPETVKLPGFHVHNGTIAKKKALTQKRVAKHRENVTLAEIKSERKSNAPVTLPKLPDQDQDKTKTENKNAREIAPRETDPDRKTRWLAVMAIFPEPPHANWIMAEHHASNAVEKGEATWDEIEAGVKRYAAHIKATGIQVQEPSKWFSSFPRKWLSPWTVPPKRGEQPAPNHDAEWAEAKSAAKAIGFRDPLPGESARVYATEVKMAMDVKPRTPIAERRGLAGVKRVTA